LLIPNAWSVAVGNQSEGPTPKVNGPGCAGVKKSAEYRSMVTVRLRPPCARSLIRFVLGPVQALSLAPVQETVR